jgi:OmpA-OmpF porin, OOP family
MKRLRILLTIAICCAAARARADCAPASLLSTCIDADTFWPHAGPSTFTFVGGTDVTAPGRVGVGLVTSYLRRPIVLSAPSADPGGNEIDAVDHVVDSTFLWSYGVANRTEIFAALSTASYRTGTGVSALAAQTAHQMPHTVLRDTRLGATYAFMPRASGPFSAAARLAIAFPTGDETSFAGDRSIVGIPGVAFDFRHDRWLATAELGARIRRTSDLLGARVGSQIFVGLGAGVHVLTPEILSILVEAVALPTLTEQRRAIYAPDIGRNVEWSTGNALVPAEWTISVRSVPLPQSDFSVGLSGGGRLPLTGDPGVTTPVYRFSLAIRYAPAAR